MSRRELTPEEFGDAMLLLSETLYPNPTDRERELGTISPSSHSYSGSATTRPESHGFGGDEELTVAVVPSTTPPQAVAGGTSGGETAPGPLHSDSDSPRPQFPEGD